MKQNEKLIFLQIVEIWTESNRNSIVSEYKTVVITIIGKNIVEI